MNQKQKETVRPSMQSPFLQRGDRLAEEAGPSLGWGWGCQHGQDTVSVELVSAPGKG